MSWICPECSEKLKREEGALKCLNGHIYEETEGVFSLMKSKFHKELSEYLAYFEEYRNETLQFYSGEEIAKLPYFDKDEEVWRLRQLDLEVIDSELGNKEEQKILDVGSWNGWLANYYANKEHVVIAIDYFLHERDGLKAKKFYDSKWTSVQMDINDPSIIDDQYDLIIFNRCLPYFNNLSKTLQEYKKHLTSDGKIIITGINYIKKPKRIIDGLKKVDEVFYSRFGRSIMLRPTKGYVDKNDIDLLKADSFNMKLYPKLIWKSVFSILNHEKPTYYFAVYHKNE